jgi:photosystem II stability/assembly factor-like uncharacterized protein
MTPRRILAAALTPVLALGVASVAVVAHAAPALAGPSSFAWQSTPTGSDDQFRGLDAVSDQVAWVAGEEGTVMRTTDGGATWDDVSPTGLDFEPAFRDVEAWDAEHAVVLSIGVGSASRIYETTDGGATWSERFRNADPDPASFYDCMAFSGSGRGLALSDPVGGFFRLALTTDFGHTWRVKDNVEMPPAVEGEFAFAASGTCLVAGPWRNFWFVTGGIDTPRIFHSDDGGRTWSVEDIPMRGGPTAGIYSVDFRAAGKGVMVGGDFEAENDGSQASAYRNYTSGEWLPSVSPVLGYRSGVAFVTGTPNTAVAVGPTGSDVSLNGGRTWTHFDDSSFDSISCAAGGACWASGLDGAVARLSAGGVTS